MKGKVVVGLSGGVDSSAAAYLLKKEGYEVIGVFMINWKENIGTLTSGCSWEDDITFAEMTAKKLGIPFHVVDLSEQYREKVVQYMFSEYEKGRTPNPDVLCNREIKFDMFLQKATELGAEYVATGHYCRKDSVTKNGEIVHRLLAGTDSNKDQSYFLCQLNQKQLAKSLFPVGHLLKPEVREIARRENLITAERKDSQGICFVGKVDLPVFLQQKLEPKKGNVIEIPADFIAKKKELKDDGTVHRSPFTVHRLLFTGHHSPITDNFRKLFFPFPYKPWNGKIIGEHNGAHFFTIGQRKGMNIGGYEKPLFVIATDVNRNIIYVGEGQDHPGLYRPGLFIPKEEIHWVRPDLALNQNDEKVFLFRIRYRQPLEKGKMYSREEGLYILFEKEQRGITSGQFAAWYLEDELIGSGVIA